MQEGQGWLRAPDSGKAHANISNSDIYEVTASKVDLAIMELKERSFIKISPERAIFYTGHYYICPAHKDPYLVRSVYGHAGTGAFTVKRFGNDLLIEHRSLGHSNIYRKSALVVNLDFQPEQLFIRVRIAE